MEYIILRAAEYDDFIVLRGKRVKTDVLPFWPFYRVTFILDKASAMHMGPDTITVSEAELLTDAAADWKEIPVATVPVLDVPVVDVPYIEPSQLTLWEGSLHDS